MSFHTVEKVKGEKKVFKGVISEAENRVNYPDSIPYNRI